MKFEFKEGQWFDVRKLTDWQKQWCLDNLVILSSSKYDFEKQRFHFWIYLEWGYTGYYFGSASERHISLENEITFNDFFWEDKEVSQESIFDNPRWVTSKKIMVLSQGLELITGKDYKVVETIIDGDGDKLFKIVNSLGVVRSYNENHFHKVKPEDLLSESVIEDEESFDNLVYRVPDIPDYEYWMIKLKDLSKDQLLFITSHFKTDIRFKPDLNGQDVVMGCKKGADSKFVWTNNTTNFMPSLSCHYFSFNDLFQEVG